MRNKHNEGYTLPLVMVVLLVLAIVAVTIMTTSMNNMLRQQQFIDTMNDQYKAQGQIEEIIAKVNNGIEAKIDFKDDQVTKTDSTLEGVIVVTSGNVTIHCGIKVSAEHVEETTEGYKITGDPTIAYTSYEIIKGGAAQ